MTEQEMIERLKNMNVGRMRHTMDVLGYEFGPMLLEFHKSLDVHGKVKFHEYLAAHHPEKARRIISMEPFV